MAFARCKRHRRRSSRGGRSAARQAMLLEQAEHGSGSACEASDRAVVESCWRVCRASRLAPSSLESASVRLSAPVCSVLIIALVNSWRICTVDRLEPNDWAWERSVVSAAVRSVAGRGDVGGGAPVVGRRR